MVSKTTVRSSPFTKGEKVSNETLSPTTKAAVLTAAFLGLVFDGVELGLMPVASLSVSRSLLGEAYTPTLGGEWFAKFTAALLLGAAVGGIVLGNLGDRIGRARAMGISILFYLVFAACGAWAKSQEQMLVLRFLVGAWAASKWMIPWADSIAGATNAGYKASTQGWWAVGATIGSFVGAQLANWLGRRRSYFLISLSATALTIVMFQWTAPLQPSFHPVVFAQGLAATLFFGWLAVYLPELFPTSVRATGSGLAFNSGRFATAAGVLIAGWLFTALSGDYPRVGTICAMIYGLGMIAIWFAPDRSQASLQK